MEAGGAGAWAAPGAVTAAGHGGQDRQRVGRLRRPPPMSPPAVVEGVMILSPAVFGKASRRLWLFVCFFYYLNVLGLFNAVYFLFFKNGDGTHVLQITTTLEVSISKNKNKNKNKKVDYEVVHSMSKYKNKRLFIIKF